MAVPKKPTKREEFVKAQSEIESIAALLRTTDPSQAYPTADFAKAEKSLREIAYAVAKTVPGFDAARYANPSDLTADQVQTYIGQRQLERAVEASNTLASGLESIVGDLKKENKLDRARALPDIAEAYESAIAQQAEATAKKAYDDAVKKTKDARLATAFRASVIATYKAGQTKVDMEKIVTGVLKEKLKTDPNQARSLVYALAK